MAFTDFIVICVVCRGYFYHPGSKVFVNVGISNDFYITVNEREGNTFSDEVCITLIIGMNHNCRIPEIGLRTGCGYGNMTTAITEGVAHMIKVPLVFFVFDFDITEGAIVRTPVDHVVTTYD